MSEISSDLKYYTDTIADYQRRYNELEQEQSEELDRANERRNEQVEDLARANEQNLQDQEEEHRETIADIKEETNDQISRERAIAIQQVKEHRKDMYDQTGRHIEEMKNLQSLSDDQRAEYELQLDQARRLNAEREESYHRRFDELAKEYKADLERTLEDHYSSLNESRGEASAQRAKQYQMDKERLQQEYEDLSRQAYGEASFARQEAFDAIREKDANHRRNSLKTEKMHNERVGELAEHYQQQSREEIDKMTRRHREELADLGEKLDLSSRIREEKSKARAEGRVQAIEDYEGEFRFRENAIKDSYERELAATKERSKDMELHLQRANNLRRQEQDERNAKLFSEHNRSTRQMMNHLEDNHERQITHLEDKLTAEKKNSQRRADQIQENAARNTNLALREQDAAYKKTLENQGERYKSQIMELEKDLNRVQTTSDVNAIAPVAEQKLQSTFLKENQKNLDESQELFNRKVAHLRDDYQNRFLELINEKDLSEMKLTRRFAGERDSDRANYYLYTQDLEESTKEQIREKDLMKERELGNLQRHNKVNLDKQRRQLEEVIENQKRRHDQTLLSQKAESDFKFMMAERRHRADFSRMKRAHDQELSEQKLDFDTQINELEEAKDRERRLETRDLKTRIDIMDREHKRNVEQLKLQNEQRIELLSENYEKQIESIRRANERLRYKKG